MTEVIPNEGTSEAELLAAAASLEIKSEHPLAKAVIAYADEKTADISEVTDFEAMPGNGLKAKLNVIEIIGGNQNYISEKIELPDSIKSICDTLSNQGKTPTLFSFGGKLLGIIALADTVKPDSGKAVTELRNMGLRVIMLTGDNERTARATGLNAGIDEVIADVLPREKEKVISTLQSSGKVAMVGDGINDAPALTRADIGIAVGTGTDIAIDAADAVLMNSALCDVPAAVRLSRATLKNIYENLFWAFFYNVVGIPLAAGCGVAFGITLSPMFGAAAMSLSSLCVVMNALRLNFINIHDTSHDKKKYTKQNQIKK